MQQGALKDDDLDRALKAQQETGERLGEILVELDLLSRPALDRAVAGQSGVELEHERGYGTGLRAEIERRHRGRRGLSGLVSADSDPVGRRSARDDSGTSPPETKTRHSPTALADGLEETLSGVSERIAELRRELQRLTGRPEPAADPARLVA